MGPQAMASLLVAIASGVNCGLSHFEGQVYGTGHFEEPTVSSEDACCAACSASAKCKAYTWAEDTKVCYLKDNTIKGEKESNHNSGVKGNAPAPAPVNCTLQKGVEFLGNDVTTPKPAKDEQACCSGCADEKLCKFFTYEGGENGLCHFKNNDAPDYSRQNASCTSGFVGTAPPAPPVPKNVNVTIGSKRSVSGDNFVCWNIDASPNRGFFWRNLSAAAPFGAQLAKQAAALGKAQKAGFSLLRFGGSGNDYMTYEFGGAKCPTPSTSTKTCMNETVWKDLLSFTEAASARMIFGLSMNTGEDADAAEVKARAGAGAYPYPWDPANAKQVLQWTIEQGLDHLIYGFELGNEQNKKYTSEQTAVDFEILHNLTIELWPDASKRPVLFGPDPHSFHAPCGCDWITGWLDECKKRSLPIFGVTHHEYTEVDGTSFTSPTALNLNAAIAESVNKSIRAHDLPTAVSIFGGEIGPHNGGSPVCDHSTMRWANFGDSLWYADALASKAYHGYSGFCRQDYIGADYGMLDCSTGTPLPDYYTALLWATTMGTAVLDASSLPATIADTTNRSSLRIYAHCTAPAESESTAGSVTVLVINLSGGHSTLSFGSATISRKYVLEPLSSSLHTAVAPNANVADKMPNTTGILGTGITLNGKQLALGADGSLPSVAGEDVGKTEVIAPPTSISFFVLAEADHADCK